MVLWSCALVCRLLLGSGVFPPPEFVLPRTGAPRQNVSDMSPSWLVALLTRNTRFKDTPGSQSSTRRAPAHAAMHPTPAGPRATRPNQLAHPIHLHRRRQPNTHPRASKVVWARGTQTSVSPVCACTCACTCACACACAAVRHRVVVPRTRSSRSMFWSSQGLRLAGLPRAHLSAVWSALPVGSQAGPCTSGDPISGLGTARHKPSQASPVQSSPANREPSLSIESLQQTRPHAAH